MNDSIIARLGRVRELADAATEGPWEAWADQDGKPHMNGLLMVGNAAAVIPEGETWIEGVDINPIAHCYTPEDRRFISAARTDVPMLVDALKAVMEYVDDTEVYGQDGQGMTDYEAGYTQALKETQDDVRRILKTRLRAVQDAMGSPG